MNRSLEQLKEQITKVTVRVIGIGLALVFGLAAGSGNFMQVGKLCFLIAAILYVLFIQEFTWKIVFFVCTLGLNFAPAGFLFGSGEIMCGLLFCLFVATWWRKEKPVRPVEVERFSFKLFNTCLVIWIVYNGLHMYYNILDPYWAGDIAIKNLLKTYMEWAGLPIVVLYFMNRPHALKVNADFPKTIGILLLACLVINLLIRLYALSTGRFGGDESLSQDEVVQSLFRIPIIGATENIFIFRGLGPSATLLSIIFLGSEWIKKQAWSQKAIYFLCLSIAVIGTLVGGGRASILISIISVLLVYLIQRKFGRMFCVGVVGIFMAALANLLYHTGAMQHLPQMVLRSSAVVIINKNADAETLLHGSNDWRKDLFLMALNEWRSDSRIFWFGRSTYSFGYADELDIKRRSGEGVMLSTLRRGHTHNLITDLLVVYGLVGFILYMLLICTFLWFVWGMYRYTNPNVENGVRSLALYTFLNTAVWVSYAMVAGGAGMIDGFMLLLIISRIYAVKNEKVISTSEIPIFPVSNQIGGIPSFSIGEKNWH